jgi:hypothetical protein
LLVILAVAYYTQPNVVLATILAATRRSNVASLVFFISRPSIPLYLG